MSDVDYLLEARCMFRRTVWNSIIPVNSRLCFYSLDFKDWIGTNLRNERLMGSGFTWCTFFGVAIWRLWYWRN